MSNPFETAHAFTAQWEGGLTNQPADPGGLTNYGVSLRWVQDLAQQARQSCLPAQKLRILPPGQNPQLHLWRH